MKNYLSTSLICTLFLLSQFVTSAQDWPQWRGETGNSKVKGFKAPAIWPAELKPEWKITVGTGDATPVLSGNKLYLNTRQGGNEVILCLDAGTGKELWRNEYPSATATGPAASHPGPRSTPAIADGKVITFGATGILSCVDAGSGKLIWRRDNPKNLYPQFFTSASPLVADNLCIIHTGSKDNGELLVLDLKTGNEIWKWAGDGPSYSSPSILKDGKIKQLILQTEKNLIALNLADGKIMWQIATPVQQRYYSCTSPYVDGQTIYFTGQGTGMKAVKIEKSGNDFIPKELWSNTTTGAKWNTPILKDGFLYGFSDQKRIYCINSTNGETAWTDNAASSDFSTIVDCGSVIIGLTSTSNLIIFKADPAAYKEIAKYKVSDTPVYTYPVVSGDKIYVKDAESLMLYKL